MECALNIWCHRICSWNTVKLADRQARYGTIEFRHKTISRFVELSKQWLFSHEFTAAQILPLTGWLVGHRCSLIIDGIENTLDRRATAPLLTSNSKAKSRPRRSPFEPLRTHGAGKNYVLSTLTSPWQDAT